MLKTFLVLLLVPIIFKCRGLPASGNKAPRSASEISNLCIKNSTEALTDDDDESITQLRHINKDKKLGWHKFFPFFLFDTSGNEEDKMDVYVDDDDDMAYDPYYTDGTDIPYY